MYKFSKSSNTRLSTCHPDLVRLLNELIKHRDFSVLCGHRSKEEQDAVFNSGNSKVQYPNSKHNAYPSVAVDIQPYPMSNNNDLYYLMGYTMRLADELGIKLRWGGDWNGNHTTGDDWQDAFHIELVQ